MARPKIDKNPARLTVTLDEQDYAEVCRLAASQDVSAAWIIRRAVQSYLGRPAQVPTPAPISDARQGR
jgi:Ribbon-helix-helix protein, copG family